MNKDMFDSLRGVLFQLRASRYCYDIDTGAYVSTRGIDTIGVIINVSSRTPQIFFATVLLADGTYDMSVYDDEVHATR